MAMPKKGRKARAERRRLAVRKEVAGKHPAKCEVCMVRIPCGACGGTHTAVWGAGTGRFAGAVGCAECDAKALMPDKALCQPCWESREGAPGGKAKLYPLWMTIQDLADLEGSEAVRHNVDGSKERVVVCPLCGEMGTPQQMAATEDSLREQAVVARCSNEHLFYAFFDRSDG